MNWRGSTTVTDRIWSSLPYLLPLVDGLLFGIFLFREFPALQVLFIPLAPLLALYSNIPFFGLAVFFALFLLVVRNTNINHFIRFNTMQAILLDIVLVLCRIVIEILQNVLGGGLILETLMNVVFLGMLAAVVYSVVQTGRGEYAEIPTISEAVHMQVR
ncbi:MAG TPA: Tic20 family protein [Leptolyngbyaceae cyanobacterium]